MRDLSTGEAAIRYPKTLVMLCTAVASCACSIDNTVTPDADVSNYAVAFEMETEIACGGDAGCPPQYWENHEEDGPANGFAAGDDFDSTSGADLFDPNTTLHEAVRAKCEHESRLERHGSAT